MISHITVMFARLFSMNEKEALKYHYILMKDFLYARDTPHFSRVKTNEPTTTPVIFLMNSFLNQKPN